ncbi:hypothetical protein AX16_007446 [Volvariella volvacea WC 439]|nr:hypothetical protein AX16_007446 [Volvariella volvacea WC 439]
MSSDTTKPVAILFGGSGQTGSVITEALLQRNEFQVKIATRSAQADLKPALLALQSRGVGIVTVDIKAATLDELTTLLRENQVHTIICTLMALETHLQTKLIDAAVKAGGIHRFVTSDWGTPGRKGVRQLHDEKWKIRDYARESGLGYTCVDVGLWYQNYIGAAEAIGAQWPWFAENLRTSFNGGTAKAAFVDMREIGKFAARIISDDRTLNRYVFVWGDEIVQNELLELTQKYSGKPLEIIHKTTEEVESHLGHLRQDPSNFYEIGWNEYTYSVWVLGEDIKEKAVLEEYGSALLGKDLYPDITTKKVEDFIREFYAAKVGQP